MPAPPRAVLRQIPGGIWVLGLVSLLMDVSSEMIHSLLALGQLVLAGLLRDAADASATFYTGAALNLLALLTLSWRPDRITTCT